MRSTDRGTEAPLPARTPRCRANPQQPPNMPALTTHINPRSPAFQANAERMAAKLVEIQARRGYTSVVSYMLFDAGTDERAKMLLI